MFRLSITMACVGLTLAVLTGCSRAPWSEPASVGTPTSSVDNTREEGPPLTYEEIERGLVGRWVVDPSVTDIQAATEWRIFPDRTWESPTLRGFTGRYELMGADSIRMIEDNGKNVLFRFQLVGDTWTVYFVNEETSAVGPPMVYHRLSTTPSVPTAEPTSATSTSVAGTGVPAAASETAPPATDP